MKILLALLLISLTGIVQASNAIDEKVTTALAAESRPETDRERDRNRRPLDTLNFFGLKDDMRVLELLPGGGWYTRLLAPVLADNGKLYVAIGAGRVDEQLLSQPGFEQVEVLATSDNLHRSPDRPVYLVDDFEFGISNIDIAVTFRNLHNFDADSRARVNSAVLDALRPGGLYGVVDHTRRHMEADDPENRRRIDPVLVIKEMLEQGFEFVDYTNLHFRADDELEYEVGRRSVSGNTDRFTLLFRKPL